MRAPSTLESSPPVPPTSDVARSGRLARSAATVAAATLGMWALSALALAIYTRGARAPELHVLEIPAGTSEAIAAGENPLEIPASWSFLADDTLRLVNHDAVDHWIGVFQVPALETVEYRLGTSVGGSLFCTIHPSQAIEITVEARDFDWRPTVLPTLVLGPTVGLILVGVGRVLHHLDDPDDPVEPGGPTVPSPSQGASHEP